MDAIAGWASIVTRADLHLRTPPRIMDARSRGAQSPAHIPRNRPQAGGLRPATGLHPRRTASDYGASVLRVLGIPDHRLFRSHSALWHSAGFHVLRGLSAPARHWRDSRLGAIALPFRRSRTCLLRRNP